jgi:hypothetical protein
MAAMAECMAWPGRCVGLLAAAAGCWLLIAAPAVSKRWGGVAGRMVMAKIKLRSTRPNTLIKKKVCACACACACVGFGACSIGWSAACTWLSATPVVIVLVAGDERGVGILCGVLEGCNTKYRTGTWTQKNTRARVKA